MNSARVTQSMRQNLWAEAAATSTKLENILVYENDGKSSHEKFWTTAPKYARQLKPFGTMGVIKILDSSVDLDSSEFD